MKNWLKGAVAALALAAGSAGISYAQDAVSQSQPLYRTNDAIFATPKTVPFSRDKDISLTQYLGSMKDSNFYALDPLVVLKGKINYLKENGPQVRKYFTEDSRKREIAYCQFLMTQIGKEKRDGNYANSLKQLENAVKDGVITTNELKGIEGNVTYAVGEKNKLNDVPMLAYISNAKTAAEYEAQIEYMKREYDAIAKLWPKLSSSQTPQQQTPAPQAQNQAPAQVQQQPAQNSPAPQQNNQANKPAEKTIEEMYLNGKIPSPQQNVPVSGNDLELIIDGTASFDTFGARAGLRWKVAGMFGLGFTASGAYGLPQTISSSQTAPSPTGRYFVGSTIDDNRFKASLDLEASLGDKNGSMFFGIGPTVILYNEKTSEQIKDATGVVKSNYNSEMKLVPGIEAYLGYNVKWFRMALVYNSADNKFSGELGVSVPFNSSENKQ